MNRPASLYIIIGWRITSCKWVVNYLHTSPFFFPLPVQGNHLEYTYCVLPTVTSFYIFSARKVANNSSTLTQQKKKKTSTRSTLIICNSKCLSPKALLASPKKKKNTFLVTKCAHFQMRGEKTESGFMWWFHLRARSRIHEKARLDLTLTRF
jgi:hypothetical protein